jgi:hypothetical protein
MRGHNDIQAIYNGIAPYTTSQAAGHFEPLGPPRVLRTARTTSGDYLATVLCTVTVHIIQGAWGTIGYMRGVCTGGGIIYQHSVL